MPSKKRKSASETAAQNDPPRAQHKIVQSVVRTVWEGLLVHCYLECGHLITMPTEELGELSISIECWACEASQKEFSSKSPTTK